jgi:nicotinamidase-related amidase
MSTATQLPIPNHFIPDKVGEVWRVPYQARALEAKAWGKQFHLQSAASDRSRICLLAVDVQNTFCIPEFELFVGGRSGMGAVEDNIRLCEFIYRNLDRISEIALTMDTHSSAQIFHSVFWVNEVGEHPPAMTEISWEDVEQGVWKVNPAVSPYIGRDRDRLQDYVSYYVRQLDSIGKYRLTIWPYHAILGGIGHAIVSAVEEACFFHSHARSSEIHYELKGNNPLTEHYSAFKPEVMTDGNDRAIAQKNTSFLQRLLSFDAILIAGQAKSHCVAWTVDDLLNEIQGIDANLTRKVYLLEDCTSAVVVPEVIDFTERADAAFKRFADAGMHLVKSTDPMDSWLVSV